MSDFFWHLFLFASEKIKNEPKEGVDSSFHLKGFSFIIGRIENKMG